MKTLRRFLTTTKLPDVLYYPNAISEHQARVLANDYQPKLNRKKFEINHYDSVIRDYREIEIPMKKWSADSQVVLNGMFTLAFQHEQPENKTHTFLPPHVLELKANTGVILPHVDSIKHGGGVVAVLSLLSPRKLVLTEPCGDYAYAREDKNKREPGEVIGEMIVEPLSLYVLFGKSRYHMSHAIDEGPETRVSIVFRDDVEYAPQWTSTSSRKGVLE